MEDLTKEFIAESQEGLERMESLLTELEKRPGDGELVAEIFRSVHTIKGTTGFLGFGRLEALAHAGEDLLGAVRKGSVAVSAGLISGLLELMDGLRAIVQLIETTGTEGQRSTDDDRELIELLGELKSGKTGLPGRRDEMKMLPAYQPLLECATQPQGHGQNQATAEAEAKLRAQRGDLGGTERDRGAGPGEVRDRVSTTSPALETAAAVTAGASGQQKTLRIDVEVLNRVMNLVGDLVLTRNQILQSAPGAANFPELARRLDGVTADLREAVMQARMQPVGHLFGKFPRMVRDLGVTCGRQVRIEFEGQETGLDKSLLEAVRAPLTHAVRNAVDHGIEPVEERIRAGKAAEGVIRLRTFHQSGWVVIEISDDGAGIPVERVLAKAVERGMVTAEQASSMSEREAMRLVFEAGFSTATVVTNVSGRGVGMDVVRANVEKVGGSVELESRAGVGTTVRLRVPLTLAIIQALVVRSGGQSFALPQNSLMELIYLPQREVAAAVERIGTTEVYRQRDRLLPLVWLDRLLGLPRAAGAEEHGFYIVVVEAGGCRFGMVVDDLMAPEEIVVKSLSKALRKIGVFSGATVLGNGTLAMILDLAATGARAGVLPMSELARGQEAGAGRGAARQADAPIELQSSMVIYETWRRGRMGRDGEREKVSERMAMPLSAVERIESVPLQAIEYVGGEAVLQYRGEVLALEDEGEVLVELNRAATGTRAADGGDGAIEFQGSGAAAVMGGGVATVLICLRPVARGIRRVGMVVRRVVDVTAGRLLAEDSALGEGQLVMVKDRVTAVRRESGGSRDAVVAGVLKAARVLEEVA